MLSLSWRMLRARWSAFAGTFAALCLGVCLLATTGLTLAGTSAGKAAPIWYATADIVVAGTDTATVPNGSPSQPGRSVRTPESSSVPAGLPARLATVDGVAQVVTDRWIPADIDGRATVARPWPAASLQPYTLIAGGPPASADQVVLTAPTTRRLDDPVVILTAAGRHTLTVAGIVRGRAPAVYLTEPVAADWAGGRIDALGLRVTGGARPALVAARVRAAAGGERVLTGAGRRAAEPDPDAAARDEAVSLLGMTATVAVFVSIFVVAGTFSFAVAQRRRELALLRAGGATPRQVRRLVLGEAMLVGALAGLAGCGLSLVTAPPFAHWLARAGFAPAGFTARLSVWPLLAAAGAGLLVALLGVWLAARRAARVRPIEALRDASVDRRVMTAGRWVTGLLSLGGAGAVMAAVPAVGSADGLALTLVVALLALVAATLFAPALVPVIIRATGWPLRGTAGLLARANAVTAVRRSAATAAPVLITVGIAACVLTATATLSTNERASARDRVTSSAVALPTGTTGVPDATVAALRSVPGVRAAVPARDTTLQVRTGNSTGQYAGRYVGQGVQRVLRLPVLAGSVSELRGTDTVVVTRSMHLRVGERLEVWLADTTPVRLRVVAVLADSLDLDGTLLLPWDLARGHGPRRGADVVYLSGGDLPALNRTASAGGGRVVTAAGYAAAAGAEQDRGNRLALLAVLGMALLYTGISIANTQVMAVADRTRDLAALRLGGATPRQVLRMIGLEASLVSLAGVVTAAIVAASMLAGLRAGLAGLVAAPSVAVPWGPIGAIAVCCVAVAVLASLVPAALALRTPAARLAAIRE